ncbi:MAG: MFS transporter [Pirellulales bacterium]
MLEVACVAPAASEQTATEPGGEETGEGETTVGLAPLASASPSIASGPRPAPPPLRKDLRAMLLDGGSYSVMVGMGETYLPAFVLALGMDKLVSGLIITVPLLAGAVLQLVSPAAVRRLGSHRRWIVLCAATQATAFLPLAAAALLGHIPLLAIFLVASVYWGAGMATGPAWNTWVETLVPGRVRARYFSRRNRLAQAGVLLGFVAGGLVLDWGDRNQVLPWAFAGVFLFSAVCRYTSALLISSQSEPEPPRGDRPTVSVWALLRRLGHGPDGKLLLYLIVMQFGVQMSGPYFTPFIRQELKFTYLEYMVLIGTSFVFKSLAAPFMGRIAHRCGARGLLTVGGLAVVPMSAGWLVSTNFGYLLCLQAAAGTAWAGYELAMFLLYIENIRPEERTSVLTTYNVVHSFATVAGSLVGAGVLILFSGTSGYLTVFAMSFVARLLTVPLLRRVPGIRVPAVEAAAFEQEPQAEALLAPTGGSATGGSS